MNIQNQNIELKPASVADREKIFTWLTQSDLTASMLGPPTYPEHPIPTWQAFCDEYPLSFFNASGDGTGRCFIVCADDEDVGTVGYDLLNKEKDRVVLDIWMKSENYCGHGYGSDALKLLCTHIHREYHITNFIISPSARNQRAIAAYKKAGFECVKTINKNEQEREFGMSEYDDNVLMLKRLSSRM